ncbi:MAG: protein translocase subunit SecD, partial [Candidatus Eremiobacteraeota bacterium]|nr:protein translocase subunit SecD [Candidatus Eremiobacteraeota bacterium]
MSWNRLKNPLKALVVLAIAALCVWSVIPIQKKIHLGLDLQGGVRVLLQLNTNEQVPQINSQVQGEVEQVIQNRINGLGVTEPIITRVGSDRLLVELPQVKNPDEATKTLKEVAQLEFKIIPESVVARAERDAKYARDPNGAYKDSGPVVYSGAELKNAVAGYQQNGNAPVIYFYTKNPRKFGELTQKNLHRPLGIFLDKHYISAPVINAAIFDSGIIEGNFTQDDTIRLANELNAGALPVGITIIENDTIGPTLGAIDLKKSLYASMFGLGLVLIFMIAVYRLPGLLADLALIVYVLMMLGLLATAKATLTLPGIAGFVLSIGMAVDANVLIF